jgi:hypothetical protein
MKALGLLVAISLAALPLVAGDDPPKDEPKAGQEVPKEPPTIKIPEPGVPQIMNMEGRFVRAAYNNEGYAILGYRIANLSVGQKWMLIDFGLTVRDGVPDYTLTRDALTLDTPDGKTLPLASIQDYREAKLGALEKRAQLQGDKINYFPHKANYPCRIGFFSDVEAGAKAWDRVELNSQRACMGRLFFEVPDGIAIGQHWLNVKFEKSVVRVPFRILTEQEYKILDKHYKNIEKQVEDAFKPKPKPKS